MNNYQIRLFANSRLDIVNEVICCCSRMTSHFHRIITRNFPRIYLLDHWIAYNKNFFLYRWAIRGLSFNQITIIVASMQCCFIILFIRGGLCIGFVISVSINSIIIKIRVVINYVSVYTTSYIRLSILNYSITLIVK